MSRKIPRLSEISPTADQDFGQVENYFLIWMHIPGGVKFIFPTMQLPKNIT